MYKLITCDLDGTLLNNNKTISDYTRKVISAVEEQGVEFVIATGRSIDKTKPIYDTLNLSNEIVSNNGATIYDKNENLLYHKLIPNSVISSIVEIVKKEDVYFLGGHGRTYYFIDSEFEEVKKELFYLPENIVLLNFSEVETTIFERIVLISSNFDTLKKLENIFNGFDELNSFISQGNYLDITHNEVSKGEALKFLARSKNIDLEHTLAIGDAFNDYEMLKVAGRGIVMTNGFEELKNEFETSDFTNDEDGVAKLLVKIFSLEID